MAAIAIDRFHARYRMPAGALSAQPRLQQIVTDALDRVVEGALDRAGVGHDGLLCIRNLHALVRLRLREPDALLAASVGDAVAEAVLAAVARTSPSVVHYRSRAAALTDMAVGALTGDFERRWAWTQIGLWRGGDSTGVEAAAIHVMRALGTEPHQTVAVLSSMARARPEAFVTLLTEAAPVTWSALARAVWLAHGAPVESLDAPEHDLREPQPAEPDSTSLLRSFLPDPSRAVTEGGLRKPAAVNRSEMVRAAANYLGDLPPRTLRALAAIVACEIDPAAVASSGVRALEVLARVERDLHVVERLPRTGSPSTRVLEVAEESRAGAERFADSAEKRVQEPASLEPPGVVQPTALTALRATGATRFGGLLYLINVAGAIGLPGRILSDARLTGRGSRWVLHQIAMLFGIGQDDPAALAFAGLGPDQLPPASIEAPADVDEARALVDYQALVLDALRAALQGNDDSDDDLIRFVCRRPAVIAADPGWIDVELPLDEQSIEIRRAGLDRDPGWVPWLGVVVRFTYV